MRQAKTNESRIISEYVKTGHWEKSSVKRVVTKRINELAAEYSQIYVGATQNIQERFKNHKSKFENILMFPVYRTTSYKFIKQAEEYYLKRLAALCKNVNCKVLNQSDFSVGLSEKAKEYFLYVLVIQ